MQQQTAGYARAADGWKIRCQGCVDVIASVAMNSAAAVKPQMLRGMLCEMLAELDREGFRQLDLDDAPAEGAVVITRP